MLAVGAPYEDQQNRTDAGVVHLFTDTPDPRSGRSGWTDAGRLTASDADSDDNFGFSVALDGDRLLVGSPSRDATAEDDGAVYAFARSDGGWSERERLTAPTPDADEHFGTAVALDGDDAVVGAPGRDGDRRDEGAAFAFAYAAGGWTRAQTLTVPAGEEHNDAEFGAAVALDAGTLAVGAPRGPSPDGNQGLVYTFNGDDGAWAPRQSLIAHDPSRGARVGAAVAVSGTAVVAGAPDDDVSTRERLTNPAQGSVTVWAEFVAEDDAYTTGQGVPLSVPAPGVLANDANPSGGSAHRGAGVRTRARHARAQCRRLVLVRPGGGLQWRRLVQLPRAGGHHVFEPGDGHDHRPPAPDRRPGQLQHPAGHAAGRDRADRRAGQRHQRQRRPADRPSGRRPHARHRQPQRGRLVHLLPGGRLQRPGRVHLHRQRRRVRLTPGHRVLDRDAEAAAADRQPRRLQHRAGHAADRDRADRRAGQRRRRQRRGTDRHRGRRTRRTGPSP